MYTTETVLESMNTLVTSTVESERKLADEYLGNFQNSPEAWSICRSLLSESTSEIPSFLSSQIMYKKTVSEWFQLSAAQKKELVNYFISVISTHFPKSTFRKLCQCLSMIGTLSVSSIWPSFIQEVLSFPNTAISLEVIDCIPACLDEISGFPINAKAVAAKIEENCSLILVSLDTIIEKPGCFMGVIQVLKDWNSISLPIFSNTSLYLKLKTSLFSNLEVFDDICESFVNSLSTADYADMLRTSIYKSSRDYLSEIPEPDRSNLIDLLYSLSSIPGIPKGISELVGVYCTHYSYLLMDPRHMNQLWTLVLRILSSPSRTVAFNVCEFLFELKIVLTKYSERVKIPEFFGFLLKMVEGISQHCIYVSYEHYFEAMQSPSDNQDEMSLINFRSSIAESLSSIMKIFEKHHVQRCAGFLGHVHQLVCEKEEFNSEVYIFIIRCTLEVLVEKDYNLLKELPSFPLVIKGTFMLLNDVYSSISSIPEFFPTILNYALTQGFNSPTEFMIHSTAIEFLLNLSYENVSLFSKNMIVECKNLCYSKLRLLDSKDGQKMIECVLNLIMNLPDFQPELQTILNMPDFSNFSEYTCYIKGGMLWSTVFSMLSELQPDQSYSIVKDKIQYVLTNIIGGLDIYGAEAATIASSLFKKAIRAFHKNIDQFIPQIFLAACKSYAIGRENLLSVLTYGITYLGNEYFTHNWVCENYEKFFNFLIEVVASSGKPEVIYEFFEINLKLYEKNVGIVSNSQILVKSFETGIKCLEIVKNRNPSKAVLTFFDYIYKQDNWVEIQDAYSFKVVYCLFYALGIIHVACQQFVASLLSAIKLKFPNQFTNAVYQVLNSRNFESFSEKDKERIFFCLQSISDSMPMVLKGLIRTLSNIIRGLGTIEDLVSTEISIKNRS